eukprot:CAMPEP_0184481858 /NCGR_PEP_ID=MMETSP0113_2-20130426/3445_1 /TAXON_ID=91329 /ORGANISM="Norrisiella sphaerica, Strain BC52" /LENGTH=156 /DNA_ID=CAMNT_0026861269 /DNA_START=271 /DNA_END=741 /DNA_ORIENTATION=+
MNYFMSSAGHANEAYLARSVSMTRPMAVRCPRVSVGARGPPPASRRGSLKAIGLLPISYVLLQQPSWAGVTDAAKDAADSAKDATSGGFGLGGFVQDKLQDAIDSGKPSEKEGKVADRKGLGAPTPDKDDPTKEGNTLEIGKKKLKQAEKDVKTNY